MALLHDYQGENEENSLHERFAIWFTNHIININRTRCSICHQVKDQEELC